MRIHFIIHEDFEAPGAYETWAKKHRHTITYSRVYLGEPLPQDIEGIDFLIVMGAHKILRPLANNVLTSIPKVNRQSLQKRLMLAKLY